MLWEEEDTYKGAKCIFSNKLHCCIYVDSTGEVNLIEDTYNTCAFSSLESLESQIERLTQIRDKVKEI